MSLKAIVRKHIVDNVLRVKSEGKWKVLVIDQPAMKIINSCLKMNELMEENITRNVFDIILVVEPVEKRRQPYPSLEAVYLLFPNKDNVHRVIEDFTRNKYNKQGRMYGKIHLFFLLPLDDMLFQQLKNSTASPFIGSLKELYLDFIPYERQVFSLQRPYSLITFYGTQVNSEFMQREYFKIGQQIASFCVTLNEFPVIRYSALNGMDRVTSKIAGIVYDLLDQYSRLDSSFPSQDQPKSQLLICDRSIDCFAPLLHEFTQQAMMNDLLPLSDEGLKYKYTFESNTEGRKTKEVLLDPETDQLWNTIRHAHIADTNDILVKDFNQFLKENKAALASSGGNAKTASNLKDLKDVLSAVPQFHELKSKFSVHINIAQECMSICNIKKVRECAQIEQELATGETADGGVPKQIEVQLIPLLDDPQVNIIDKVRLLMLYIIGKEGVKDEDRRKLFEHANIPSDLSNAITNLAYLGVKLSKTKQKSSLFGGNTKKKEKRKIGDEEVAYDLSRYVPQLKYFMYDLIEGSLKTENFPFAKDPHQIGTYGSGKKSQAGSTNVITPESNKSSSNSELAPAPISLRTTKPSWQHKKAESVSGGSNVTTAVVSEEKRKGPRFIAFIVGGATFSELRSIYELSSQLKKDVYIGATHLTNPSAFVDDLKNLKNPLNDVPSLPDKNLIAKSSNTALNSSESLDEKKKGLGKQLKTLFSGLKKDKGKESKK